MDEFSDSKNVPSAADVGTWVSEALSLPQYAKAFELNGVDGPTLLELDEESMLELGILNVLHRKKILGHIKLLRPSAGERGQFPEPLSITPRRKALPARMTGREGPRRNRSLGRTASYTHMSGTLSRADSEVGEFSQGSVEDGRMYHFAEKRGTFSNAKRRSVFSPTEGNVGPGPNYSPRASTRGSSPRATIGRAARNTSEYLVLPEETPGIGRYNPSSPKNGTVKGGTFSTAARLNYGDRQSQSWLGSPRRSPGPGAYRQTTTFESNFRR
uniref:SAM domain-containing protein n=1 Tax=Noctiluca scintillans TaxID=2966 RepID=A0A7S1B0A4_NOCSC